MGVNESGEKNETEGEEEKKENEEREVCEKGGGMNIGIEKRKKVHKGEITKSRHLKWHENLPK